MKRLKSKIILIVLSVTIAIFFSGCQNLFVPINVPVVLKEGGSANQSISIQSYNMVSPGVVQDISNSGNNLIILNAGTDYNNIDTFNTDTQQLSPFINSDKQELSALYDSHDAGIYYVEKTAAPMNENVNSQLLWTDINKNITRIISAPEENVLQSFGINQSGQVVYANNNNELILADTEGNREIYTSLQNYAILSVDYIEDAKGFVFIADDPNEEEKTNLYYAKIKDDSSEITPRLIVENVNSFDINDVTNQIVFVGNEREFQIIGTWSTNDTRPSTIATGNFGSANFTPDGKNIFYTQYSPNYASQSQSIWVMDANGANHLQVTAPLKLNSRIICHPSKSALYFSVAEDAENINSTEDNIFSQTFQITYKID